MSYKADHRLQGESKGTAQRTPPSPAPSSKSGAKQPSGSGGFNVERTPFGKKVK